MTADGDEKNDSINDTYDTITLYAHTVPNEQLLFTAKR